MKKTLSLTVICAAFLLFLVSAFAGGSYSFRASCSIPAIPGVNAPLIEETAAPVDSSIASAVPNDEINTEAPEETGSKDDNKNNGQNLEETENNPLVLVKTIYSK